MIGFRLVVEKVTIVLGNLVRFVKVMLTEGKGGLAMREAKTLAVAE